MDRQIFTDASSVVNLINKGYIRIARHPKISNLAILNYTQRTQYEHYWNPITRKSRGLVVDWSESESEKELRIVIESPQKFFNKSEPEAPDTSEWNFKDDIFVSEKYDGYYISVRNDSKYGLIITSRGSFDNQYVDAARKLLPEKIPFDTDYFCELCQDFSEDKNIIVSRHPTPRLVCWGVNNTVPTTSSRFGWEGEIAQEIAGEQVNKHMSSKNEGIVIFNRKTHERVKIKTQWYMEMHRAISNCTYKRAIEVVSGGGNFTDANTTYVNSQGEKVEFSPSMLPEEHIHQLRTWEHQIRNCFKENLLLAQNEYNDWKSKTPKDYALGSKTDSDIKSIVFAYFRGRDSEEINQLVWSVTKKHLLRNSTD